MRGRKAKSLDKLDHHDFTSLLKTKGNPRERRRYLAFAHLQEGKSFTETAKMVKVQLRTLMNWVKNFRKNGLEGLKDQQGRGAKPHLSDTDLVAFQQAVLELQSGRTGGRIKGRDVLLLMEKKFGIRSSRSSMYDTLKRADLVWITGRSQHPKANIEVQEAFKKNLQKQFSKPFPKTLPSLQ
jgi:transposase